LYRSEVWALVAGKHHPPLLCTSRFQHFIEGAVRAGLRAASDACLAAA
jgi:monoamine oxidase